MQPLKYIYNEHGEKEAVIVPIADWERLLAETTHQEPKKLTAEELQEISKHLEGVFPPNYAEEVRKEWDRPWDV